VRDLIDGDHEEDGEASMGGMSLVLPLLLLSYGNMDALRETLRAHLFVTHRNGQLYKAALRYAQLLAGLLQSHGIELASDRANVQKKLIHSALQDLAAFDNPKMEELLSLSYEEAFDSHAHLLGSQPLR